MCFIYKSQKVLVLLIILFLFVQCQSKFDIPERVINSPINVVAYPTNQGIIVKFYGNNLEEGFRGYNVYVGHSPGIRNQNLSAVKNRFGSVPTLLYGSPGCYPDASQKSFITIKTDSFNLPITNRKRYYVTVTAYLLIDEKSYESEHSNEAEIEPLNEGEAEIYNHKISGKTNDGIVFNTNGTVSVIDAPDTILSGWGGDFVFELIEKDGTVLPYIVIKSNQTYIQDLGYYENINEIDNIPVNGYIQPDVAMPVIDSHLYVLYKVSTAQYIRVYILSAPSEQTSELSDVSLKIKWAF